MKIKAVFPETPMYYSHLGLAKIAMKRKIDVKKLEPGEFVVFVNRPLNACKIFTHGNVIAYLRTVDNRRLEMRTIQLLPSYFRGGQFHYDKALEQVLKKAA